ncbi:MAG: tRNA pseudouridine(55) synthase TruB [Bacteroidales bacterium]|nr:tRNA pseudouridine(55) synthase TruB [Bacteroidales bacterium]
MENKNEAPYDFAGGEVLLIRKPYTWSSFDVINSIRLFIRHNFNLRKVKIGHAGTLDPLATGLIILCTGKYTKRIEEFQAQEKEYIGTLTLGATTPSFDMETDVDQTFSTASITTKKIQETAKKLTGTLQQIPPIYSAIRVDGKRLYSHARKGTGDAVEIHPREVTVYAFEITAIHFPVVWFRVVCSKGTYIRALARDFGEALECGAYMSSLQRTRIGNFHNEEALSLDEFREMALKRKKATP